jgi:hypothetical protein
MATKQVATPTAPLPNSEYLKKLGALGKRWRQVEGASDNLSKAILVFAQEYVALEEEANQLDNNKDDLHQKELKKKFQSLIEKSSESVLSKWRKIGKWADKLLPYSEHLPTNYESLYMISQGVEDETFDIEENVQKKYLTPATTVRNLRITIDKKRAKRRTKSKNKKNISEISVTLVFTGTHGDVGRFLAFQFSAENLKRIDFSDFFDANLKRLILAKETKDALEDSMPDSDWKSLSGKIL